MNKPRFTLLAGMIAAAALSRLAPHPPNFTPIAAMALFAGAEFSDKRAALLVPLAGLMLSDLALGFYRITPVVYASFALIVCLGFWVRRSRAIGPIAAGAVASALLFFALTNFGVWAVDHLYPKTAAGLAQCYLAGIPFLKNTLASDLFYSAVLFGGLALAERRFAPLREFQAQ